MTDYTKSKYGDPIAEWADSLVNDGWSDETIGSVSEPPFEHYALVTLTGTDPLSDGEAEATRRDYLPYSTLLYSSRVILRTDERGFVDVFYGPAHPLGDPPAHAALMRAWAELSEDLDSEEGSEA